MAPSTSTTQSFHYGTDGSLANDTTGNASANADAGTATTASYLLTAGREARTLQPGTTASGTVPKGAPAPVSTGTGTGYLLVFGALFSITIGALILKKIVSFKV